MTERKFHKTIIQVEILSEEPYVHSSLEQLDYNITYGDCCGTDRVVSAVELNGKQAADELFAQGSEPGFFRLTDEGEDSDEQD